MKKIVYFTVLAIVLVLNIIYAMMILTGKHGWDAEIYCNAVKMDQNGSNPYLGNQGSEQLTWNYLLVYLIFFKVVCVSPLNFTETYPILKGEADAVFGSRMLGVRPMEGGMPWWKYIANIFLTAFANIAFRRYLTEIHSGFRAYSRKYLETVHFEENSNDFIFDTEIIAQGMDCNLFFREVPIVTRYFPEASSINFRRSTVYGFGILAVLVQYILHHAEIWLMNKFESKFTG